MVSDWKYFLKNYSHSRRAGVKGEEGRHEFLHKGSRRVHNLRCKSAFGMGSLPRRWQAACAAETALEPSSALLPGEAPARVSFKK